MTNQPLEARWLDFANTVSILDQAPQLQTEEMRVTFFCGAVALYDLICKQLKNPSHNSNVMMQRIHDELGVFMQQQMHGGRLDS